MPYQRLPGQIGQARFRPLPPQGEDKEEQPQPPQSQDVEEQVEEQPEQPAQPSPPKKRRIRGKTADPNWQPASVEDPPSELAAPKRRRLTGKQPDPHAPKPAAAAEEDRPGGAPVRRKHLCTGFLQGRRVVACSYNVAHPGTAARGRHNRKWKCMVCSPEALQHALGTSKGRGSLVRTLKALNAAAADHPNLYIDALERVKAVATEEQLAQVTKWKKESAEEQWERCLEHRKRVAAKPTAEEKTQHQENAETDERYVRNRFFPKQNHQRRKEHPQWAAVPTAADEDNMEQIAAHARPGAATDPTGLPEAIHPEAATFFQRWCRHGSWQMCAECHRLEPRKLAPSDLKREPAAEIKKCKYCKSEIGYPTPQPDDVPEALRKLSPEIIQALRPLTIDVGKYERADNGYRVHTAMAVLAWDKESAEDKIEALPSHKLRKLARAAREHLLAAENNAYADFEKQHTEFLESWDGEDETQLRRPLRFIETVGLENALWPHLYWTIDMCETAVRAADCRRARAAGPAAATVLPDSSDEEDEEEDEAAKTGRQSLKASFLAKVMGPLIGYGADYELFHFVYDLHMWTTLGSQKNAVANVPMRLLLKGRPFSPAYWKVRHAALVDLQRQMGYPSLFFTIAPYEWSFPYHNWIVDEMNKALKSRLHLPAAETFHMAHAFAELARGWMTGLSQREARPDRCFQRHVLQGADGQPIVGNYFARLEYQDGKRKEATQAYHGSGRLHMHMLLWIDHADQGTLTEKLSATVPADADNITKALILGSQPNRDASGWQEHNGPNTFHVEEGTLLLHHSEDDADAGLRAYFPDVLEALRCHQDVLQADGRGLLLKYVASYVPKFSDSFAQDWLNDEASDYAIARKILFDYHPLEPEMWLQLGAQLFPCSFTGGTMLPIVAPYAGMAAKPKFVENYEACGWRGEEMTLLEFLRKANTKGEPLRYIREAHKAAGSEATLEQFARDYNTKGEKLIAAETYWRLNDLFYGQWMALHVPFRKLEDLHDEEVKQRVPAAHYYLACAVRRCPEYWRNEATVRADLELEAVGTAQVETILSMLRAKMHLIDQYLDGTLNMQDEAAAANAAAEGSDADVAAPMEADFDLDPHQTIAEAAINTDLDKALAIEGCRDDEEAEELRQERARHAKPTCVLGPPGTGKTTILKRCIRRALENGGRCVLIALPTGQLASRMREEFKDSVDIDTCHGAFLLHRPEQESLPTMAGYSLVVIDEFPQLSRDDFDRILRIWQAAGQVPALVFAGDFYQLPGVSGTGPKGSRFWKGRCLRQLSLHKSWRSSDATLLKKLKAIRTHVPKKAMLRRILRKHKAWSGKKNPTPWELKVLLRRHPDTTIVTCTRLAAAKMNRSVVGVLHFRRRLLGEIDGDFDANEENYDEHGQLLPNVKPQPSTVKLYKGLRLHLTRNLDKLNDFVNGMEATVEAFDAATQALRVRTRTGKRLAVYRYTDPDHHNANFFPVRYGYASTIYKMQGAQLPHVTIWLDRPGMRAAGYVAMSRVRKDGDYLFGGIVKKRHLVPAM